MLRKFIIACLAATVAAQCARAALLIHVEGSVLVNKGDGFHDVSEVSEVNPGDRVLVRGDGFAQIDHGNGCLQAISANETVVVVDRYDCGESFVSSATSRSGEPVATGSLKDAAVIVNNDPIALRLVEHHVPPVMSGLMAAGAAAVLSNNDKKDPASP